MAQSFFIWNGIDCRSMGVTMRSAAPIVRAEEGCIRYEPCLDIDPETRANFVTIVEEWVDEAHLKKHLAADHMARYRDAVADLRKSTTLLKVENI